MKFQLTESHNGVTVGLAVEILPASQWQTCEARGLAGPDEAIDDEDYFQAADQARSELLSLLHQARLTIERSLVRGLLISSAETLPKTKRQRKEAK